MVTHAELWQELANLSMDSCGGVATMARHGELWWFTANTRRSREATLARTGNPPAGYVDMAGAMEITGLGDDTIGNAARNGEIPGAVQRKRKAPWFFKPEGLRKWALGEESEVA